MTKKMYFTKNNWNYKINNFKIMFFMAMMLGTIISINSNNWINAWIGMEINMLSFIPLMMNKKSSNSMMMYFIIQAMSSSIILFVTLSMKMEMNMLKLNMMFSLIQLSLLIKLGASPMHWWTPKIFTNMNWKTGFLFLTWQKITPIFLLNSSINNNFMIYISTIFSVVMGTLLGLNQTSMKLILIYSSINHTGWMLMTMMMNMSLMKTYFIIYSIMNLLICTMMNNMKIKYLNQLFKNNNQNIYFKMMTISMFMSLGGIPPMIGFLPKMLVLIMMMKNKLMMESLIFIIMAMMTISFYINPIMSMFLLTKTNKKWNNKNMQNNKILMMTLLINFFMSLMILPMMIKFYMY